MLDEDRLETIRMVRDSAAAIVPEGGGFGRIRALRGVLPGFDRAAWAEMAALGWIGLRQEGMGMSESVALLEALGRGLVPEPLVAAWLAVDILGGAGETGLLRRKLAGESLVAVAWQEAADGIGVGQGRARRFVPLAGAADEVLLPVRRGGLVQLLLVPAVAAAWTPVQLQDGGFAGELVVPEGAGRVLAEDAGEVVGRALDHAALGMAAYLLGVAEQAFAMTLDYLKQRVQFGQALAGFQALQHRAADIKIQLTLTRASVEGAAAELDGGATGGVTGGATARQRAAVVSRAKARAGETALLVAREAIQLHGAIGYADEHDIGLFARKAMVLANAFGSPMAHRRRYLEMAELSPA